MPHYPIYTAPSKQEFNRAKRAAGTVSTINVDGKDLLPREYLEQRDFSTPIIKEQPIEVLIALARSVDYLGSAYPKAKTMHQGIRLYAGYYGGHPGLFEVQALSKKYGWHEDDIDALYTFWGCIHHRI